MHFHKWSNWTIKSIETRLFDKTFYIEHQERVCIKCNYIEREKV